MLIDTTLKITPRLVRDAQGNEKKALTGHLGTHFDVMDKEFPLAYTKRSAVCFDVRGKQEVELEDICAQQVRKDIFVIFYTGFIEKEPYGSSRYFKEHPQLSQELITFLLEKEVSLIGIDCAGIRRGKEHTPADQRCADWGAFVIENLCNLGNLPTGIEFIANTYPMNYDKISGLPCRVVMEV